MKQAKLFVAQKPIWNPNTNPGGILEGWQNKKSPVPDLKPNIITFCLIPEGLLKIGFDPGGIP